MDFAFKKKELHFIICWISLYSKWAYFNDGGSEDPTKFSKNFDFQRLTLAPILLAIGFIIGTFAVMYRKKKS